MVFPSLRWAWRISVFLEDEWKAGKQTRGEQKGQGISLLSESKFVFMMFLDFHAIVLTVAIEASCHYLPVTCSECLALPLGEFLGRDISSMSQPS